jgi:hypothetical protein
MRRSVWGGVIFTVLALGVLGIAGFGAYQLGYHQGLVETGTQIVVNHPGIGYYPGAWGFGAFGLFFRFLFVFLFIGLIAKIFFGRRHWGGRPYWADKWENDRLNPMEQRLADWHERAHQDPAPDQPDSSRST